MAKTASELRDAMLVILDGGNAWTRGANARGSDDVARPCLNSNAVKWDIFGALIVASFEEPNYKARNEVLDALRLAITTKNKDIEYYNDQLEWAEVESLLNSLTF